MYEIKQEGNEFVVYCKGKRIEGFPSEKKAMLHVEKATEYKTEENQSEQIIID